jgi:hypothetical protein
MEHHNTQAFRRQALIAAMGLKNSVSHDGGPILSFALFGYTIRDEISGFASNA